MATAVKERGGAEHSSLVRQRITLQRAIAVIAEARMFMILVCSYERVSKIIELYTDRYVTAC